MERLTLDEILKLVNKATVQMELDNCKECSENYKQIAEYLEELKSFKEAEEQGLLVRLPCKVGDSLYCIMEGTVKKLKACSFIISGSGIIDVDLEYEDAFCCIRYIKRFGENVFLTREETGGDEE